MKTLIKGLLNLAVCAALLILSECKWPWEDDDPKPIIPAITDTRVLPITPLAQQTEVWCWAAVAEMVLRYNGLPNINPGGNYQCGLVAAYYGTNSSCWVNCFTCVSPIGPISELQKLVNQYGPFVNTLNLGFQSKVLTSSLIFQSLTLEQVAEEIKNNRPIIAGISPSGFSAPNLSQHFTVIVGYDATGPVPYLIVNDPFPFGLPSFGGTPNPYIAVGATSSQAGQYKVSLAAYVSAMRWANALYMIK